MVSVWVGMASDENLLSLAHHVKSPLFFAHIRASTGTATSRANCHPFHFGRWMFMHNGKVGDWDKVRRPIERHIPDALFVHRHGTTDSEAIFLLLLALGLESNPERACAQALALIEREMEIAGCTEPLRFTAACSDGRHIYAVRYANSGRPETLYTRKRRDNSGRLLVSEPLDDGRDDWQAIPPQSFVVCDDDGVAWRDFKIVP
jgi:predicted glutamine amidotransferase